MQILRRRVLPVAAMALTLLASPVPARADNPAAVGGERLAATGFVTPAGAPALPATAAAAWLVADLDTGEVLAAKNPHGRFAPASTLKTLTALTLIPRLDKRTMVRPTFDDVNVEGSRVGLVNTVSYPVDELFRSLLMVSGNDAARALATANGGLPLTLEQMNAEARRIQAYDTTARNTSGLDAEGQYSSAYDLALIAREAMKLPTFREYVATKRSYIRGAKPHSPIQISSHDRLLWNYPGAIGIKNGFTSKARATFVGAATRGGRTLVVTLLRTNPRYWPEARDLLDWGFKAAAQGVEPVGELVEPTSTVTDGVATEDGDEQGTSGTAAADEVRARPASAQRSSSVPLLPAAVVGSGLLVMASGFVRTRRRRPRKMKLPPI